MVAKLSFDKLRIVNQPSKKPASGGGHKVVLDKKSARPYPEPLLLSM